MPTEAARKLAEKCLSAYELYVKRGEGTAGVRDRLAEIIEGDARPLAPDPIDDGACPKCGSGEIEGGSYDYETPELGQKMGCNCCGHRWIDVYVLTRRDELA